MIQMTRTIRTTRRISRPLVLALVFIASSAHASFSRSDKDKPCPIRSLDAGPVVGEIKSVVDGDTVHVTGKDNKNYKIRMVSIDAPETNYEGKSQGYWGEAAHDRLAELLPVGTEVRVELDATPCDQYGRILGHVWKGKQNINRQMVADGFAVNYCIYPNVRHCEEFGELTDKNQVAKKGVFSDPGFELPYEWRRLTGKRPFEKFVGSIESHDVYKPGSYDRVSVGQRVFFMKEKDIQPPFHLSD
jgi:endonuclease YncB( thermonuclease family)